MVFDPNSAQPEAQGFDPTSAQPDVHNAGGQLSRLPEDDNNGHIFGKGGRLDRLGHLAHGEFESAVMNGFGGLVARKGFELAGVPKDQVNAAVIKARQDAQQEIEDSGSHGFNPVGFGAAVVGSADPTYLINPGAGVAKNLGIKGAARVATRVIANAGSHAAMGSGTDAAYQLADEIDGLQKGFDIKRNLAAAGTMAGFGAAHAGISEAAPIVSDFVADLFKKRGVDTLPDANPTGRNTPLTTDQPSLNDVDRAQLQGLIRTGSPQEIKQFFADKQGPSPTWSDVHSLTQFRDRLPENYVGQENLGPALDEHIADQRRELVSNHIVEQTSHWKNAPDFEVHDSTKSVTDPIMQADIARENAHDAPGLYDANGKVHIFTENLGADPEATLNALIYHEGLGHHGLAQAFGTRLDSTIGSLLKRNVGQFGKSVDEWQKKNPGAYNGDRVRAGEEVLANMSNSGTLKPSLADALVAQIRGFGRKMGMKLSYSDAEVRQILNMAHQAVINGKGRNAAANGFRYMFTGKMARTFDDAAQKGADEMLSQGRDPEEVRRLTGVHYAEDRQPRMEISDDGAHLRNEEYLNHEDEQRLGNVLHHPRLYDAYPHLEDLTVKSYDMGPTHEGGYEPATKTIHINTRAADKLGTIIHETQHAVQHEEGRPGMDVENSDKQAGLSEEEYAANPLEKEAYATEARRGLSGMELRNTTPAKFIRQSDLEPKDAHEELFKHFGEGYKPRYRSQEEARQAAEDTALDPGAVRDSRSVGNLDRKLFVYDNAAKAAHDQLMSIDASKPLTDEEVAKLLQTTNDFHYVLGRLDNDLGQVGRALNAAKALTFSRNKILALKKALEDGESNLGPLADSETASKFLKQYQALIAGGNPNGAAQLLKGVSQPYWWQYLLSARHNMMLSGLSTHLKSVMDMATTAGRDIEEKLVALPAGAVRSLAQNLGLKVKDGLHPTEVAAHLWGLMRASLDGQTWADTGKALRKGNLDPRYANRADPNIPILNIPTHMIAAQDTFYRSVLGNANLYGLGARLARDEFKAAGKSASFDDIMTAGAAKARNPTPHMLAESKNLAENTMLLNPSPINAVVDKMRNIRPGMGGWEQFGSFWANMLFPFIRVSSNALMNQVIRRSPLSFLDPLTRADWAAGGPRRDLAIARTAMGTAMLGYYWAAADPKKDKLTAQGPDNYAKMKELEASGWQRGSVHENGRYNRNSNLNLSLNPFDLHNNTATMVAGLREAFEKGANKGQVMSGLQLAMASMMHELGSQTFIGDLGPMVDAFEARGEEGVKKTDQFIADEVKTFIPNVLSQTARMVDPNKHDVRDHPIIGAVQASIPGMTGQLPIKYNVYGQPEKTGTSITGIHTVIPGLPGNGVAETTDPTEQELGRLAKATKAAIVTPTLRTIRLEGYPEPLKLTTAQAEEYQKYAGQRIVETVRQQMQSGEWTKLSDVDKVSTIREIQKQAKRQVKEALVQQPGWLNSNQRSSLGSQAGVQ